MTTDQFLMNNYGPRALNLVKGEGVWVWDDHDNRYLDAFTGVAVCNLGHSHPAVTRAIAEQAATLVHCSNHYLTPQQQQLGERLCALTGMTRAFFCNSGAEANEAAIKLARLFGHQRGIDTPTVIVVEQAFHGRTLATLSATGSRKAQAGFEPLVAGFVRAPFDDIDALEQIAANNANVVGILVEPVQGEGGVHIPARDYLPRLRALCDRQDWLLMLDEVQTGNGRTGQWYAYQHHDLLPDVLITAKGLGNGFPIGACLARGTAAELFQPGSHGSTFGGNPLACATALAVLDTIEREQLLPRVQALGARIRDGLQRELAEHPGVKEVRGLGLMLGIELHRPCPEIVGQGYRAGILINHTGERVIRLLPPFILSDAEADQIVALVSQLVRQHVSAD